MPTIENDRTTVRQLFADAGARIDGGDSKAANEATAAAVSIADGWDGDGRLVELLAPLLGDDESEHVRYSAASVLLNRGHADRAVPVLESLDTFLSNLVLDRWREQQEA